MPGKPTTDSPAKPLRGRGRPPAGPEAHAATRRRLLDATRAVFSRVGYHGLSVELILAESGLSRPTYYKYFRNTEEPITIVIQEVNDLLIERLKQSSRDVADPFAAIEAGLTAWRDWGTDLGPMLRPLFAELHDAHSPASAHRLRTLAIMRDQLMALSEHFGRPRPTRIQVDALLNGVEYLGYRFHLDTPRDELHWKQTRDAMLRLAIALLGSTGEWAHAGSLAQMLNIDLAPQDVSSD